jgi:hypothetical protein
MDSTRVFVSLTLARFDQFAADMRTKGLTAGQNFNTALFQGLKAADANVLIQLSSIKTRMTTFNTDAQNAGKNAGQSFNAALTQGLKAALANTQIQIAAIKAAMTFNASAQGNSAGVSFGAGVANGLYSMQSAVYAAGQALAIMANAGFNSISKPGSPSKLGMQSGGYYGEGIVAGVESWLSRAASAGEALAHAVAQPIVADSFMPQGGFGNSARVINNYFILTPEELERMQRQAEEGSDFANEWGFASGARLAGMSTRG